jgi:hypothetical protein
MLLHSLPSLLFGDALFIVLMLVNLGLAVAFDLGEFLLHWVLLPLEHPSGGFLFFVEPG